MFYVENKKLGFNEPVYFIADIAANHDGDIERAKDLIFLASESGANAAKFQHFNAKTIVSEYGFQNLKTGLSHQEKWKKSVFSIYQDATVDLEWTNILKKTCEKAGISFFTTPYSLDLVDYIDNYVTAYKIGSGDITWFDILKKIAKKNKPYFLATGASNFDEVKQAVDFLRSFNNDICLMQCNTNYTASLDNFKYINLNVLNKYKETFPDILLGLSDHTPGHSTVLGAVTLGAKAIEKHFTDDNNRDGPDHLFSMNPSSWKEMVLRTKELELSLGNTLKKVEENEKDTVIVQRRSLRAKKSLKKGVVLNYNFFEALRPCPEDAIVPSDASILDNKILLRDINKGDYLKKSDIKT